VALFASVLGLRIKLAFPTAVGEYFEYSGFNVSGGVEYAVLGGR
jgi:hypothetical protein